MKTKKGDFNFVWLFAIIAGTAFLILAVFFAIKMGGVFKTGGDAEITKSVEILADPLQAGFAAGSTGKITFAVKSQINPSCYDGGFGYHMLSVISESDALKNNPPTPIEIKIPNKYIFAQQEFGKEFYILSKKFEMGFPVTDMLFISTKEYCLVNPPERIKEELMGLNIKTMRFQDGENDTCSADSPRVCFGYADSCNMTISGNCYDSKYCLDEFETGTVTKEEGVVYYAGDLLYGAIFSKKDLYDCNINRLLYRTNQIAQVYLDKADLMDARGCNTDVHSNLAIFSQLASSISLTQLPELFKQGKILSKQEEVEECGLW